MEQERQLRRGVLTAEIGDVSYFFFFFFQEETAIRVLDRFRGLGVVYKDRDGEGCCGNLGSVRRTIHFLSSS